MTNTASFKTFILTRLDGMRMFADITLHPVVSPDNWHVYSDLCDLIDNTKNEIEKNYSEEGDSCG